MSERVMSGTGTGMESMEMLGMIDELR